MASILKKTQAITPDLLTWHLQHDGYRPHENYIREFERDGDAWNAAFDSGREAGLRERSQRQTFWFLVGFAFGAAAVMITLAVAQGLGR